MKNSIKNSFNFLLILLISISCNHKKQSLITISIDSLKENRDFFRNYSWTIQGTKLCLNENKFSTQIKSKEFDTLYFENGQYKTSYILSIPKVDSCTILANQCCDDFYFTPKSKTISNDTLIVKFKYDKKSLMTKKKYLLTYGLTGHYIENDIEILIPRVLSAMESPNYNISICEILPKKLSAEELHKNYPPNYRSSILCKKGIEIEDDFNYLELNQLISFKYIPLKNKPLILGFDESTKKHKIYY